MGLGGYMTGHLDDVVFLLFVIHVRDRSLELRGCGGCGEGAWCKGFRDDASNCGGGHTRRTECWRWLYAEVLQAEAIADCCNAWVEMQCVPQQWRLY